MSTRRTVGKWLNEQLGDIDRTALAELCANRALTALKRDAARYRWIKNQLGLTLESDYMQWTREDGTKFRSSHRLCANDTAHAPYPTLDETIDAAMTANDLAKPPGAALCDRSA